MRSVWPLLCLPLLAGCTISAVSEADRSGPSNSCSADSDCEGGTQRCRDGLCQAVNGSLESLLITVTPPSNSPAPHLTFVTHKDEIPPTGGDLQLAELRAAKLTGSLKAPIDCNPTFPPRGDNKYPMSSDKTLPVSVVLRPRESLLGLPQQLYLATAHLQPEDGTYKYSLQVPPGSYDAYFTLPPGPENCVVPPQLFRGEVIEKDTVLDYTASPSAELKLTIAWPKSNVDKLIGWTVDIVEPLNGNTISNEVVLGTPFDPNDKNNAVPYEHEVVLSYSTVSVRPGAESSPVLKAVHDLVRFRPPPGVVAPVLMWDRTGFGLLSSKEPTLSSFTGYPAPVHLDAWVQRADDGSPVASQVTLVSTQITGMADGILSSFKRTVAVGADGRLSVDVPPGTYKILAVPPETDFVTDESLASLAETWTLSADVAVQAGKVLELATGTGVHGYSKSEGASVQARPTPSSVLQFDLAVGDVLPDPRSRSALVKSNEFVLATDPGVFDVSVRAAASRGFAWWVRPGVTIDAGLQDLGTIKLPVPTVLKGRATAAGSTSTVVVAFGAVSAYAYLDQNAAYTRDREQAVSVVEVGQTVADENGDFTLLIPAELAGAR